jgi:LuxR family maltose regulon positive regulatory protein
MYRAGGHQLKAVEAIRAAEEAFGDLPVPPLLVGYLDDARAIGQPGAPGSAMATGLDPVAAEANGAGTLRTQVTLAAAAALAAAKDTSGALKQLAPGLGAAAPQRFRLPFVSAGEPMRNLLEQAVSAGTAESVFAVDLLNRMASPSARAGFRSSLPLTERERNVLRYLATALTAKEIAQNLYVSVNTVKTHMRSIYQKLGVDGRRDAVRYAQEFALL